MAQAGIELAELLRTLDPEAPLAERHLWLMRLLDWVRGDRDDAELAVGRVHALLSAAEQHPEWLKLWHQWWGEFLTEVDATPLLADLGFAPRSAFFSELVDRLRRRLIPATPETTDLRELFPLLFPHEFDSQWLRALDKPVLERLRRVLFGGQGEGTAPNYALRTLLNALAYAISQISATGQSAEVRTRMAPQVQRERPFVRLPIGFEALRQAVTAHGRASAPALVALGELREQLDACRAAASTVYAHLEEHGISVHIEFQLRQLRQRILRVKALLLCLETDEPALATSQLLSHLVRVNRDSASVGALVRDSTQLLAAKVTERNAETGEHYIAHDGREYLRMLGAAAGGGAVMAVTTVTKLLIMALGLSAFWGGVAAGLNYAISFVVIMLLHWTVATKQPAVTAPAMADKLANLGDDASVQGFVDEVANLVRSQIAGIVGNLAVVAPVVLAIQLLAWWSVGAPLVSEKEARYVLHSITLLGPTALFAAFTGVLLFSSSLVAGWVENWFVYHRLDSAIAHHPAIVARLGASRAAYWSRWWRQNISGVAANVSLGLLLGLVPAVLAFMGLPIDVRHVTLSTGQLAAAAGTLGLAVLSEPAFWWCVAALLVTGTLNLGVSFWLALRVALRSRGITVDDRARLHRAIRQRLWQRPRSFLLPD